MKIAIAGKGGVGKTTLSSLLARVFSDQGKRVIAIDANPDANLAGAIGIPPGEIEKIVPIVELKELIEERTGAKAGSVGAYFKLNPRVDDIPERFSVKKDNIQLLIMGTVKKGGAGCICPESTMLRTLLSHLLLGREDVVIMDMDAGLEHLGRGTAQAVNAFIIVVEPGLRSVQTALGVKKLAMDLGIKKCFVVGSKTHNEEERRFVAGQLPDFEVLGYINYNAQIAEADARGLSPYDAAPQAVAETKEIVNKLENLLKSRKGA